MRSVRTRSGAASAAGLFTAITAVLAGCGTPGAPQPPSLNLPSRVTDLSGDRTGDQVKLTWTMPRRNTDKIVLKSELDVDICRGEESQSCRHVGHIKLAPAADGVFTDSLPTELASGTPRPLNYFVEVKNSHGRSAGLSDPGAVVAGQAPPAVTGFVAEVRKEGVVLHWTTIGPGTDIRIRRTLLTPVEKPKQNKQLLAEPAPPVEQNLLVDASKAGAGGAVDTQIIFGNSYEYRAQRIAHVHVNGKTLELDGPLSNPVRVDARDVFPPSTPSGLVAVATGANPTAGVGVSIDLNWEPNTEANLAGYQVYRSEEQTPWKRISGDQPVVGPAYHDTDVLPGHTYRYAVSAVDHAGHESGRSGETQETVPKS